jgi:outer membrane protein OmpA-like peptidoglycan-associated protein
VPAHPGYPSEPTGGSGGGWLAAAIGVVGVIVLLLIVVLSVRSTVVAAGERLANPEANKPKVAIADNAELPYCTPEFKKVLERVLHSCGLSDSGTRRGCKPADVKTFANITDTDFNALFTPLKERGAVILFDSAKSELDAGAKKVLAERWEDRRGARYFFVVARASQQGAPERNRKFSHERANSVMFEIKGALAKEDPEVEKKVGLLWLGEEYAQLSKEYCAWTNSRPDQKCDEEAINRSAFVSWVDCRL